MINLKIKELYDEIYNESLGIMGSFVMSIIDIYDKYFENEDSIKFLKNKFKEFSDINFGKKYQKWYTNSLIILDTLMPERKQEFVDLYSPNPKRKELNRLNYTISDAIGGYSNSYVNPTHSIHQIQRQIDIIKGLKDIIDLKIYDIKLLIENDVFEEELDTARYLFSKGFNRSAGAICGVLLEKHLKGMLNSKNIILTKKTPSINDLNVELYKNNLIDTSQNKFLLYLGDLRNKCDHDKTCEPSKTEIQDLIDGTNKVLKTYF